MIPLQEEIRGWLSRPVPGKSQNQCFDLPAVLTTDIGLERSENQDRVAALRVSSRGDGFRSMIAIAVADGMGGMRDGGVCATLALSTFFAALVQRRAYSLRQQAQIAISLANENVYRFAAGRGGATLSAVLVDHSMQPLIIHVGDTRVYSFGDKKKVSRLTIDDSLAEAVGGHGRELLQFVGMGDGIEPHVYPIEEDARDLAIMTDGIHFIDATTLETILYHSTDLKMASDRLSALARWCGGPDNASSAFFNIPSLLQGIHRGEGQGIQVWDPFGNLTLISRGGYGWSLQQRVPIERSPSRQGKDAHRVREDADVRRPRRKSPQKKKRTPQEGNGSSEDIQLEIHIGDDVSDHETDDNSR